ncbi:MAG: Z1 domain-containing protein, partial [Crenarchaeota archaeon]|nr:Z1 domain-containing protein [Thermoproteota archaeon]
ALQYWENPNGISVIAIGGNKLSRGLTLEGLMVSYYLRASRMYDTLMQMGRWFGYRDGYLDLCRIYTTEHLSDCYSHIALATEELRMEFDYMAAAGGTPKDWGLRVRTHPNGLIITSNGKMRSGTPMWLTFSDTLIETYVFHKNETINHQNYSATEELIMNLKNSESLYGKNFVRWKNISPDIIISFLEHYQSHPKCRKAFPKHLIDYIKAQNTRNSNECPDGELINWTVALINKKSASPDKVVNICGLDIGLTERGDKTDKFVDEYTLSKNHILNPDDEYIDLIGDPILDTVPKDSMGRPSGRSVRQVRNPQNGLLILYPLYPQYTQSSVPVIGFAISFPASKNAVMLEYRVNNIYEKEELMIQC